ncbi:MAG: hypothetical protein ACYCW6_24270 [Candidatus Xenobia bacterium]
MLPTDPLHPVDVHLAHDLGISTLTQSQLHSIDNEIRFQISNQAATTASSGSSGTSSSSSSSSATASTTTIAPGSSGTISSAGGWQFNFDLNRFIDPAEKLRILSWQ